MIHGDRRELPDEVAGGCGGPRNLIEPVEGIEQVPGAELRPEMRERVRPRDGVEAESAAEREHNAALSRYERERQLELSERAAVRVKRVCVRPGRGRDGEAV